MALGLFELLAKLGEVIDLPVKDDCEGIVLIMDWLLARRKIEDTEPPHREATIAGIKLAPFVGSAMEECRVHFRNGTRKGVRLSFGANPANAAHDCFDFSCLYFRRRRSLSGR